MRTAKDRAGADKAAGLAVIIRKPHRGAPTTQIAVMGSLLFALLACTPATRDDLTRTAAKSAIRPVLAQRLPGVPVEAAADCVIDNAQYSELLALASDSVTGATASTVQIVTTILSRPGTIRCLATDGLPNLLR